MSLVDKMKKLFLEEEEENIKSEVIQVEIPAPTIEKEKTPSYDTKSYELPKYEPLKEEVKTESIVKEHTPIFFDDNYFKELEKPKVSKEVKSTYRKEPIVKENTRFQPTPIISPVYGVLNKNYNKEDIIEKNDLESVYKIQTGITIDDVRKKAYGTLEDELESNLYDYPRKPIVREEFFEELIDIELPESEKTSESELFDLIDSMYEKGDDLSVY